MTRLFWVGLLGITACAEDSELVYDRFNASGETLEVDVGAEELGEMSSIELQSSTGAVTIGQATIDPDAGPSGTLHMLEVEILEDLILAAHQDAKTKAEALLQEKTQEMMGGLGLPPGFKMPF